MITVKRAKYSDYKEQLKSMFLAHANEIVKKVTPNLELSINHDFYLELEKNNRHLAIVVEKDQQVIGYLSILIYEHPHHSTTTTAITDCFYIDPKYRGITGFRGIMEAFDMAQAILKNEYAVEYFYIGISAETDLSYLMTSLNCKRSDIVYVKNLKEDLVNEG